ncbi:hypothetical protein DSECCO2_494630 [anaerobic digester metagenome]
MVQIVIDQFPYMSHIYNSNTSGKRIDFQVQVPSMKDLRQQNKRHSYLPRQIKSRLFFYVSYKKT